jgi:transposase
MGLSRCKSSDKQQGRLLEFFVAEVTARTAADPVGINYHSAHLFCHKVRRMIVEKTVPEDLLDVEVELDESCFGGCRKGRRGRGAAGKIAVFGLPRRGGKVYPLPVPDARKQTLLPIIRRKIRADSIVYTDSFTTYDALDVSEFHHERVNHSDGYVASDNPRNHINGIENFWNQAKRVLRKYNGIPKENFICF